MKRLLILSAASLMLLLPSCRFIRIGEGFDKQIRGNGSGITASSNYITRNDVTGDFHSIQCTLPVDMTYLPGSCAISLKGPDNVLSHISIKNDRGTLVIGSDGTSFRNLDKLEIRINSPVLERIAFNGAVDFEAPQGITALDFEAEVNGAGDIDIDGLTAGNVRVIVNGAGDTDISGLDCDRLVVEINGAGDADVAGRASHANLTISGAGDIDVTRLQCPDLDSKVRGIGRVRTPKQ